MFQTTIDFSDYITERTKDFTGRDWVFRKINDWLQTSNQRVFLLTGGPGSGKSALAARLVQMSRGEVPAKDYPNLGNGSLTFFHFCQAFNDKTLNPLRFVEALSQQLANHYQLFALALFSTGSQDITINATQTVGTAVDGAEIKNIVIESLHIGNLSASDAFDRLVRRPLEQLCTPDFKDTIVILVDSLDEALTYDPEKNILNLLRDVTDHPADLTVHVRFLLTSRPDLRVFNAIGKATLNLIDDAPDDMDDVFDYAYCRLSAMLEQQRREMADYISKAAEGNFLYARYVLDELLPNLNNVKDLSSLILPKGLDDVYRQFLKRELGLNMERWEERYGPLLGVLAVAQGDGLTREQLAGVTGLTQSKTDATLRACIQYLAGPKPNGPFHIYHHSFRDFLLTDNEYKVYPNEANQAIADYFIEEYSGNWLNSKDNYALQYTPTHLTEAVQKTTHRFTRQKLMDMLFKLSTNFDFLEAKAHWLGVEKVLVDLNTAFNLTTSESEQQSILHALIRVLNIEAPNFERKRTQYQAFFVQQVHNRAMDMGLTHLKILSEARLMQLGKPYLALRWRTGYLTEVSKVPGHRGKVIHIAVTLDGSLAISVSEDGTLKVWDIQTGQEVRKIVGGVSTLAITPDSNLAICGSKDGTLKVLDIQTGQEVRKIVGHEGGVRALAITPDSNLAISVSEDGTLKVWDIQTGKEVHTISHHYGVRAVAISPNVQYAIFASWDRTLRVLDIQTGQEVRKIIGHERGASTLAITPDSNLAICGFEDGTLKVWDIQTGQEVHTFAGHESSVNAVAITPDGHRVISASSDCMLKVWDMETSEALAIVAPGEGLPFFSTAVAANGVTFLAGDEFGDWWGDVYCLRYVEPKANGGSVGTQPSADHQSSYLASNADLVKWMQS